MNISAFFIADAKPSELVEPAKGPLNHPAVLAQAAAMVGVALGNKGLDPAQLDGLAQPIGVESPISEKLAWSLPGPSPFPRDGRYRIH